MPKPSHTEPDKARRTVGLLLHGVVGVFYFGSVLFIPGAPWLFLLAVWCVLLAVMLRQWREFPELTWFIPLAAALWFMAFTHFGGMLFGWKA